MCMHVYALITYLTLYLFERLTLGPVEFVAAEVHISKLRCSSYVNRRLMVLCQTVLSTNHSHEVNCQIEHPQRERTTTALEGAVLFAPNNPEN